MDKRDDLSNSITADEPEPGHEGISKVEEDAVPNGEEQAGQPSHPPGRLAPGASVASYSIARVLRSTPEETVYLAVRPSEPSTYAGDETAAYVTLIERPEGAFVEARQLVDLGLKHPRLLAPHAVFTENERDYLALDALVTPEGTPAPTVAEGARLDPRSTLTAGAGLADALGYLHRSNVAHLHVAPEVIHVRDGRAFLAGMEQATYADLTGDETANADKLVATDANALARALASLAGLPPVKPEAEKPEAEAEMEEEPMVAGLRKIVAYGATEEFATPNDVAGECSVALQPIEQILPLLHVEKPPERVELVAGAATSVGRVRSENQDAYASLVIEVGDDYGKGSPLGLFLVADGMGGEARGELASRLAARLVTAELMRQFAVPSVALPALAVTSEEADIALQRPEDSAITQGLARAATIANYQVRELARQLGQATGTTLTAIAICGTHAALAHLGDSRAYLLRGGLLHKLTEDHSVLARLQAIDHPLLSDPNVFVPRSMLYRSLGQEDEAHVDMIEFRLAEDDRFLICSDGLWDEIGQETLEQTFATAADPVECARQLVEHANATGGHDNSTAVIVFVRAVAPNEPAADGARDAQESKAGDGGSE